jgi:GAF domain-containing protein
LHRDGIVDAVAFAAEHLLLSADWLDVADEVLARLGRAAGVSRAYIAENVVDEEGRLTATWMAEWTGPGIARVMDDINFRSAPWEESGFGRWSQILARGEAVLTAVADLPEAERPPLQLHGVLSLAKFPVFVGGEWWGAIGFDDCVGVRDWSGDELATLRASATVLGVLPGVPSRLAADPGDRLSARSDLRPGGDGRVVDGLWPHLRSPSG